MDIRVREVAESGHVYCFACGAVYRPDGRLAEAFDGDEPLGAVCASCLIAGPVAIRARLTQHAEVLRAQAMTLLQKADACLRAATEPIYLPLPEEPVRAETAPPPERRPLKVPVVALDELDVAV